ncbi:hypothetical protein FRC02_004647 [Tulasnella sp. 418]|nr:hypothetical protein FRC02_004647 [Tulasnella sp. 418]
MSKRARTSLNSEVTQDSEVDAEPQKLVRTGGKRRSQSNFQCSLPPTCNPPVHNPTQLANSRELEQHFATYHSHVCTASIPQHQSNREKQCGKVFPDTRFLDLHLIECHDPLTAVRQERGEKTFACFLPSCKGVFATPKGRRRHLIDVHGYPKEFFFSIINRGIGDLLIKFGPGASLIRGEWHERPAPEEKSSAPNAQEKSINSDSMDAEPLSPVDSPLSRQPQSEQQSPSSSEAPADKISPKSSTIPKTNVSSELEALTSSIGALSLVPSSIRFGRGGKRGGFIGRGHQRSQDQSHEPSTSPRGGKVLGGGKRGGRGGSKAVYDLQPAKQKSAGSKDKAEVVVE